VDAYRSRGVGNGSTVRGAMAKRCFCGCGRQVRLLKGGANWQGGQLDRQMAVFSGVLQRGADPEHAVELAALVERGRRLRENVREFVHGQIDVKRFDDRACGEWVDTALSHRQRLDLRMAKAAYAGGLAGFDAPKQTQLVYAGRRAPATIVEVQETGKTLNMNPRVGLRLRVEPDDAPPFVAERELFVSRLRIPQRGETVEIFYDPGDRDQFTFRIEDLTDDHLAAEDSGRNWLDELEKLGELHKAGVLTDQEFQQQKRAILDRAPSRAPR
jgi:hypothetical protein